MSEMNGTIKLNSEGSQKFLKDVTEDLNEI